MAESADIVLVTGASGYIATHVVQQLLQQGYRVRGTVRSLKNETKIRPLYNLCPSAQQNLELVEADLLVAESWPDAVKDCAYILHVASPLPLPKENPLNEDELIKPAVDGTLNVLKAASEAGTVTRVVVTGSIVSVSDGLVGNPGHDPSVPYTEDDWTVAASQPYNKSKTLAERAAWDFVRDLTDEKKFELSVLNPAFVIGPVLCGSADFASLELPRRIMMREMPLLPKLNLPLVDVRDVAAAHLAAMTVPEAAGNRCILSSENLWLRDIALVMEKEFKPQGYKIPTRNAPNFFIKFMGLFDKIAKLTSRFLDSVILMSNTRMREVLGINPRAVNDSVVDMCYSMVERGLVKKTAEYHGPNNQQI